MGPAIPLAAFLWVMAAGNYLLFRDPIYPGFLQATLWASIVTLFAAFESMFLPVSPLTLILIGGGTAAFSMGSYLAVRGHVPCMARPEIARDRLPSNIAYLVCGALALAFLPAVVEKAQAMSDSGPFDSAYGNLRHSLTNEGESYGQLMYAVWLAYVTAGMFLLRAIGAARSSLWRWLSFGFAALALVYAFLITGRGFVVFLLLILSGIALALRAVRARTILAAGLVLGLVLFGVYGVVLSKGGNVEASLEDNVATLSESLLVYTVSSIPAFDQVTRHHSGLDGGVNTFIGVISTLNSGGFDFEEKPIVQPFTEVPFPTNIYSAYQPYFMDFGVAGPVVILVALGFLHGHVYRRVTVASPHPAWVLTFGIMLYPLFMQYATEYYFAYFKQWVVFGAIIVLGTVVLQRGRIARVRRADLKGRDWPSTSSPACRR